MHPTFYIHKFSLRIGSITNIVIKLSYRLKRIVWRKYGDVSMPPTLRVLLHNSFEQNLKLGKNQVSETFPDKIPYLLSLFHQIPVTAVRYVVSLVLAVDLSCINIVTS